MTFKKQVIAVSEDGDARLMSAKEGLGPHWSEIMGLMFWEDVKMPAGLYVVDILLLSAEKVKLDVCYQLCEYRDLELYSGECKLT